MLPNCSASFGVDGPASRPTGRCSQPSGSLPLEWPVDRLPAIPSYELSGVVVDVADDVERVAVGDAVYALTEFDRDGVAAAYAAVSGSLLAPKPSTLDHVESAAIPLPALSAWQGLFDHGRLDAGQRALVTGAAGGVGQFATQLARWRGAHVIGVASPDGLEVASDLGAHEVVDGRGAGLEDVDPVDLLFDTAGGDLLRRAGGSCGRADASSRWPRSRRHRVSMLSTSSSSQVPSSSSRSHASSTAV